MADLSATSKIVGMVRPLAIAAQALELELVVNLAAAMASAEFTPRTTLTMTQF